MQVYFDPDVFFMQSRGGISTYFVKLINEFNADPSLGVNVGHMPAYVRSSAVVEANLAKKFPLGRFARTRMLRGLNTLGGQSGLRSADIKHETFYLRKEFRRGVPTVTTVHDMTPELYPESFPAGNPHAHKASHVLNADLVLCVSETTRRDLLHYYPDITARVVVTPEGTGFPFALSENDRPERDAVVAGRPSFPYVIFVGSRDRYKSFDMVPRAISLLRGRGHDIGLLLIGGKPLSSSESALIEVAGLADQRFVHMKPSDQVLADLYRNALLLAYPSEYEGFGLPVLDALASGCPVVTSDAPALMEVGGDATLVHPRGDVDALAERMLEAIETPSAVAEERRARGSARAEEFTRRRTAELTAQAYREVLGGERER